MGGPSASSFPDILKHAADQVSTHALPFGKAHVFFPEVQPECQMAFLVDVHSMDLEMGSGPYLEDGLEFGKHFNHRPYSANAHLATALRLVFEELLTTSGEGDPHPISVEMSAVPAEKIEDFEVLFAPLGYKVLANPLENPISKSPARFFNLILEGQGHPVQVIKEIIAGLLCLDEAKLYWSPAEESAALVEISRAVIEQHPENEAVLQMLSKGQEKLYDPLIRKLAFGSDMTNWKEREEAKTKAVEAQLGLDKAREDALLWLIGEIKPERVLDLGCGQGHLIWRLLAEGTLTRVTGMDVSSKTLQQAGKNIPRWGLTPEQASGVGLVSGNVVFQDERLKAYDTIVMQELMCLLNPYNLQAMTRNVFGFAQPKHVLITLPNADFNSQLSGLAPGEKRYAGHVFEWGADRIQQWADQIAQLHGYALDRIPIGSPHPALGPPSFLLYFHLPTNS